MNDDDGDGDDDDDDDDDDDVWLWFLLPLFYMSYNVATGHMHHISIVWEILSLACISCGIMLPDGWDA